MYPSSAKARAIPSRPSRLPGGDIEGHVELREKRSSVGKFRRLAVLGHIASVDDGVGHRVEVVDVGDALSKVLRPRQSTVLVNDISDEVGPATVGAWCQRDVLGHPPNRRCTKPLGASTAFFANGTAVAPVTVKAPPAIEPTAPAVAF